MCCLSPALVAKSLYWMAYIDMFGFYFLDLETPYAPPPDLEAFLSTGGSSVYVGSILIEDPEEMMQAVLDSTFQVGVRTYLSRLVRAHNGMTKAVGPNGSARKHPARLAIWTCHHGGAAEFCSIIFASGSVRYLIERQGRVEPTIVVPFFGHQI